MTDSEHNILVKVSPAYIAEQSNPGDDHYVFSYTVTIRNKGLSPAKLLTRHWIITDGDGETLEVHGEGVVGEQPYIRPGEGYQYTSGTYMKTPVGTMKGSYQMVSDSGVAFDAEIPSFTLSVPNTLH